MRVYLLSLGAGLLVGIVYSLLNVRSPAPPVVALVGLLGILIGEQVIPVGKEMLSGATWATALNKAKSATHVLGLLPGRDARSRESHSQRHRHQRWQVPCRGAEAGGHAPCGSIDQGHRPQGPPRAA